jgi:hypothetical protein
MHFLGSLRALCALPRGTYFGSRFKIYSVAAFTAKAKYAKKVITSYFLFQTKRFSLLTGDYLCDLFGFAVQDRFLKD